MAIGIPKTKVTFILCYYKGVLSPLSKSLGNQNCDKIYVRDLRELKPQRRNENRIENLSDNIWYTMCTVFWVLIVFCKKKFREKYSV